MFQDIAITKMMGHGTSGKVGKIHKKPGDKIDCGDLLVTIESDKVSMDLTSDIIGVLKEWLVAEGDTVQNSQVIGKAEGKCVSQPAKKPAPAAGYSFGLAKPQKEEHKVDVAIVGGGPGGYVAAIRAAQQGKKVLIIEQDRLGGTCLNWGCIPTKALVASVDLLDKIHHASDFGFAISGLEVDFPKIMERKNGVVETLVGGIEYLMDTHKITYINGWAKVENEKTLSVKNKKIDATIEFENLIIATGSKPFRLPIEGGDCEDILDNRGLLSLEEVPESLTIIGGGVIGMEFAFLYNALGSKVHVVEFLPQILNLLDADVADVIRESARSKGICIHEGSKALSISTGLDGRKIVSLEKDGEECYVTSEKVAMAVGRTPYLDALDLETLGVEKDAKGRAIAINERMQTSNPKIYAIGDVTNIIQLAHVASHQGIVAADAICGKDVAMDYSCVPSAIFTMPEVGQVGLTAKQATEQQIPFIKGTFPFAANGKAQAIGETKGFVQLIAHEESREILGGSIVGVHATDLISTIANLIASKTTLDKASHVVYAHPTTAESIHEALLAVDGMGIHFA